MRARCGAGGPTARDLVAEGAAALARAGVPTPRLDAEILLGAATGRDRSGLYARLSDPVDAPHAERFRRLLAARASRVPLAYLTGEKEFWSLAFRITPDVLVPRPETEILVEEALRRLPAHLACTALDIGTGCGCIAVAIARERPAARVTATDISSPALRVAAANARAHGVRQRVRLVCCDALEALKAEARFRIIASNPPYVPCGSDVDPEVRREPAAAVFAGADGLDFLRRVVPAAARRLEPGGTLLVEVGTGQAAAVAELAARAGLTGVAVRCDLGGRERVVAAVRAR